MRAQRSRPVTINACCSALQPAWFTLRKTGALALAVGVVVQGWSSTTHAWTVEVSTPTVTIATPTISTPVISTPTIAIPNIGAITSTVENTVSNVQVQVGAVTAGIADLPATVSVNTAEITAQVTSNVDTVVQDVTAATNTITASINGQGLAALVSPGMAAAGAIHVRTDVVTLATGSAVTVDFYGDGLINFAVNDTQAGEIGANGVITVASADASSIVDNVINLDGIAHSRALTIQEGQVALVVDLAPSAGEDIIPVRQQVRNSPLVQILDDPSFRPGSYNAIGRVAGALTGKQENEQNPRPVWNTVTAAFFGTVEALTEASLSVEQEAQAALTMLTQLDTLVSKERLAPSDVCQAAGGGGVGLPGCGASESFGAELTLAPDETGVGCALISAGGGIRLSCGGVPDALPADDDFGGPGTTVFDRSGTLQDLLDEWLNQPTLQDAPFIASRTQDYAQIAAAAAETGLGLY